MSAAKKPAWGEAHRREALRRTYEIAAEFVSIDSQAPAEGHPQRGQILMADSAALWAWQSTVGEEEWRESLAGMHFSPARISREVRRVDGLATGRLVRETRVYWKVVNANRVPIVAERARREAVVAEHAQCSPVSTDRLIKVIRIRIRKAATR